MMCKACDKRVNTNEEKEIARTGKTKVERSGKKIKKKNCRDGTGGEQK